MKNVTNETSMRESWSIAHFRIRGQEHVARVVPAGDIDLVVLIETGLNHLEIYSLMKL